MQNNNGLVEDDTGHSLSQILRGSTSRFGLLCQYLGLVLLVLSYSCLAACGVNPVCSSSSLNSACTATFQATAVVHPGGKNQPKPSRSITLNSDKELVLKVVKHYAALVMDGSDSAYRKAFNLLAESLRDQEIYSDFVQNSIYTLPKGCWNYYQGKASATQVNSSTWIVVLHLTRVACVGRTILGLYTWPFRLGMVYGLYEIVAVTLETKKR
jgi:hypothetical protein